MNLLRDAFEQANEFSLFTTGMIKRVTRISLSLFIFVFFSCDGRKEIPFELTDNRIIVKANINGTSGRFFWDTGANISEVNCNLDNLDFSRRRRISWNFFDMKPESKDFYYLSEITIGGVRLKTKMEIAKITKALRDNILEPEGLDGVLGINIFAGYWCEVSFSKRRIILHKKKPARFETYVPANLEGSDFRILVDVDGKESPFYIDTGAPGIYFPPSVILGKTKDEYKKMLLPKRKKNEFSMQSYYLVKTNKISVFDDSFENKTIITDSPACFGGEPSIKNARGLLGIEFLKDYDLLFDFTNQPYSTSGLYYTRINTERDEKKLFSLEEARVERILETGIYSFYRIPEGITLGIIAGSVLNSEYGVTERTIIAKIDGKAVREMSDRDMWNMDIFKVKNFTVLEERTMEFKLGNH